jgi:hypothetical protein
MWRADPGDSHPMMNEWGGAWAGPSQVQVVWTISRQLTWAQTFPTPSLLQCLSVNSDNREGLIEGNSHRLSILPAMGSVLWFWNDPSIRSYFLPGRTGPLTAESFIALAPCCSNFQQSPSPQPSFMAISSSDSMAGCLKISQTVIIPCFQVPREGQSQTIGPLSRWYLAIDLWDKGSDKIFFFFETSLPSNSSPCHTKFPHLA